MAQIVPQENIGGILGTGFGQIGSGLGEGLALLAQQRLAQMQQRTQQAKTAGGLQALGFDPQQAQLLSSLEPNILQNVVKQKLQAPSQQAFAQALFGELGGQQPTSGIESLQTELPSTVSQAPDLLQQIAQPGGLAQLQLGKQPSIQTPRADTQKGKSLVMPSPLAPQLNADQAFKIAQLRLQRRDLSEKERREAFKLTKTERKEILDKGRSARQNLQDLSRLEELEKEGKLDTPGYVEFLKRSGFDLPALMSPGSEEFQKIAQTFMRDAKTYLGSRISNFELEQFLKTIPSLSQSPEGRKRVISNLKYFNRVSLEYNKALKEVIAENDGVPPLDLLEQVDEKADKRLDTLSTRLKEDLAKPVPTGQNRLITALQSTLGSVIGLPGTLLQGASKLLGGGGGGAAAIPPVV